MNLKLEFIVESSRELERERGEWGRGERERHNMRINEEECYLGPISEQLN